MHVMFLSVCRYLAKVYKLIVVLEELIDRSYILLYGHG